MPPTPLLYHHRARHDARREGEDGSLQEGHGGGVAVEVFIVGLDAVLREDQLQTGLDRLSADVGADTAAFDPTEYDGPWSLDQIWSEVLEQACRATYARDYLIFGWQDWSGAV